MAAERRTDQAQRDRLDVIHADVLAERRRVTVLLGLQALLLLLLAAGSFYFRGQQAEQAHRAERLALAIQQSRVESVLRSCLQDAERNRATISEYDQALAARARLATPAERARLAESRTFFAQLVDAFLPKQTPAQCQQHAADQTRIPLEGDGS